MSNCQKHSPPDTACPDCQAAFFGSRSGLTARPGPVQDLTIVPIKPIVDKDALEKVENLLERIKRGEITCIAYCATLKDGGIATGFSRLSDVWRTLGALDYLMHRIRLNQDTPNA